MSTATIGRAYEYRVRDEMKGHGWVFIMRSAASKGAADLIMAHPIYGVALVQVGTASKTLGPDDRARLVTAARLCSALAILAVVVPRQGIRYWLVTRDVPSAWDEWNPA